MSNIAEGEKVDKCLKVIDDKLDSGCEPYVFTNMYFGPDNPRAGETSFAWVTGTAGWMFRAVTEYMMGFYTGYKSITIKPCIPDIWKECSVKRVFRKDTYIMHIINNNKGQNTVKKLTVVGIKIIGNTFDIFNDAKEHNVVVEMS